MAKDPPLVRCDSRPVGAILRESGAVSKDVLEHALEVQRQSRQAGNNDPLCDVLVRLNDISEEDKARCLGAQWGLPYVNLNDVEIDQTAVDMLPEHLLREHRILPIRVEDNRMTLAIIDPLNIRAVDEAHIVTGFEIVPLITTEDQLTERLNTVTGVGTNAEDIIADAAKDVPIHEVEVTSHETEELSIEQLASSAEEEPIIRLVNAIIARGISGNASDVHIQPERDKVRVRYRVDGVLHDGPALPVTVAKAVTSRIKVVSHMDIAEKRVPQDGRLSLRANATDFDLRVSTLPGILGEKIVMRIARQGTPLSSPNKLGFATEDRSRFEELIARPYGLILVTGPTGSGKSTTLYAALNQLNSPEKNIITIEDPIEQKIYGLTQIEVNTRSGLTFASTLRSVLRQDPDIAMVGEIRDRETAMLASEASLTGHLVLSTLHTNDAAGAFTRLIDMNVEPFLIASSVIGVLAQRLVRVLCPKCRQEYEASADALWRLGFQAEKAHETITLYRAAGCNQCGNTGYHGRVGVFELIVLSDEIKDLVLTHSAASAIRKCSVEQGTTTMAQDAVRKILSGVTSVEEALRVIDIERMGPGDEEDDIRPPRKAIQPKTETPAEPDAAEAAPKDANPTANELQKAVETALKAAEQAREAATSAQAAAREAAKKTDKAPAALLRDVADATKTAKNAWKAAEDAHAAALDTAQLAQGIQAQQKVTADQAAKAAQHAHDAEALAEKARAAAQTAADVAASEVTRAIEEAQTAKELAERAQATARDIAEKMDQAPIHQLQQVLEGALKTAEEARRAATDARAAGQKGHKALL